MITSEHLLIIHFFDFLAWLIKGLISPNQFPRVMKIMRICKKMEKQHFKTPVIEWIMIGSVADRLGPFQTSNFTCAESNANEKNLLFSLICIRFGTGKVRRLKRALGHRIYGDAIPSSYHALTTSWS